MFMFSFYIVFRANNCLECSKVGAASDSLQAEISLSRNMLLAAQMRIDSLTTEVRTLREANAALSLRSRLMESANAARFQTWGNALAAIEQRLVYCQQSNVLYCNVVSTISEERKYFRAIISRCKCPAALSPGVGSLAIDGPSRLE